MDPKMLDGWVTHRWLSCLRGLSPRLWPCLIAPPRQDALLAVIAGQKNNLFSGTGQHKDIVDSSAVQQLVRHCTKSCTVPCHTRINTVPPRQDALLVSGDRGAHLRIPVVPRKAAGRSGELAQKQNMRDTFSDTLSSCMNRNEKCMSRFLIMYT